MSPRIPPLAVAFAAAFAACAAPPAPAPEAAAPAASSAPAEGAPVASYLDEQAERGREVFSERCSECHYSSEMRGTQFQFEWERRTVGDLYEHLVGTMPEDDPGSLTEEQYVDVVAYILRLNGFPAGGPALAEGAPAFDASLKAPAGAGAR